MNLKKVPRNNKLCDSCNDNSRNYKFLYLIQLKQKDENPPCICKKCIKTLRGQLQRLRWS